MPVELASSEQPVIELASSVQSVIEPASSAQPAIELTSSGPGARQRLSAFLERAAEADERLAAIAREESANGPYSAALIDQLQSLALLYQEIGQDDLAVASITRALQVERANSGLYSLEQVPLIRQLIAAERARGNTAAVTELEGRLLRLAYSHPADVRSAEILHTAANRRLEVYGLYLARNLPPEITITLGFIGARRPPTAKSSVIQAQRLFTDAIGVLLRNGSSSIDELQELERKLVYAYYLELTEGDPLPLRVDALASLGKQAHERMLAYHMLNEGPTENVARSLVELADWELLFSHNATALARYREVYEMLAGRPEHEALLAELLAPDAPVVLPVFVRSPLISHAGENRDYVDVSFDVSRYGKSRKITVIGVSSEAAEGGARDVVRLIARSRFRPRFEDGEPMRTSSIRVRYGF